MVSDNANTSTARPARRRMRSGLNYSNGHSKHR